MITIRDPEPFFPPRMAIVDRMGEDSFLFFLVLYEEPPGTASSPLFHSFVHCSSQVHATPGREGRGHARAKIRQGESMRDEQTITNYYYHSIL